MKKILAVITAVCMLIPVFAGCTINKVVNGVDSAASAGTEGEEKNSLKTIEYSPEKEFPDFDYSDGTAAQKDITLSIEIPEKWVAETERENCDVYVEWDADVSQYMRRLTFYELFKVSSDFVMDGDVHKKNSAVYSSESFEDWTVETGKTGGGYDFVVYKNPLADGFRYSYYIRISDEYIFRLEYVGEQDGIGDARNSLDSIKVSIKDKENTSGIKTEMDIQAYMQYFVGYFHEPYKTGDDISDISVLNLCFLYALYDAESLDFVKVDKDTQVMTIEGEGLRKIAKNLISDGVDLSKHHSDMENSSDKYDADKDLYTVYYARDYWGEDKYCLDTEKELVITETDDAVTVTAEVQYVPNLGSVENVRTLQYTFDKVVSDGVLFYRINSIKEVK